MSERPVTLIRLARRAGRAPTFLGARKTDNSQTAGAIICRRKNQMTQLHHLALETVTPTIATLISIYGKTVPDTPPMWRQELIDSGDIPAPTGRFKDALHPVTKSAPYLGLMIATLSLTPISLEQLALTRPYTAIVSRLPSNISLGGIRSVIEVSAPIRLRQY